jgi:hypothetical protein
VTRLFELREAPLSLDECFAAVQRPEAGGGDLHRHRAPVWAF